MFRSYKSFERYFNRLVKSYFFDETEQNLFKVRKLINKSLSYSRNRPDLWESRISGWTRHTEILDQFAGQLLLSNPETRIKINRKSRKDLADGKLWRFRKPGFEIRIIAGDPPTLPTLNCEFGTSIFRFSNFEVQSDFLDLSLNSTKNSELYSHKCVCPFHLQIDSLIVTIPKKRNSRNDWLTKYFRENPEKSLKVLRHLNDPVMDRAIFDLWKPNPRPIHFATKFDFIANNPVLFPVHIYRELALERGETVMIQTNQRQPSFEKTQFGQKSVVGHSGFNYPKPDWRELKQVSIQDSAVVTNESTLFVVDQSADPIEDFVSGQWERVFSVPQQLNRVLFSPLPFSGIEIEKGALISGRNDSNWYHWVIEYLPRALLIEGTLDPEVPIIISDSVPAAGVELLKSLTHREIIQIPRNKSTRVKSLFVSPSPVQVFDSTRRNWGESLIFNFPAIQELRSILIENLELTPYRKIFLVRESAHRGLVNESKIAQIARNFGFEVVNPSKLSFREQIGLFQSAKIVMGAGGAVMANYLFMSPGASIYCLVSKAAEGFVLPAAIASVAGARFENIFGDSVKPAKSFESRIDYIHADFKVSPKKMKRLFNALDNPES